MRSRRRRGRAAVKGLVVGAMIFGAQAKPKANHHRVKEELPTANVRVSMDSFAAVPPYLAYDDIIEEAAVTHDLDPDLIHAVIQTESAFDPHAESPAGAQGLMQLMPILQKELGVKDPFDPRENIMAGTQYLKKLLDRHSGDLALALASYNAGPANVSRYKGVPPFKETRNYVKKIRSMLDEVAAD
jgi:soluble lytic murein transglycosylase-like protein